VGLAGYVRFWQPSQVVDTFRILLRNNASYRGCLAGYCGSLEGFRLLQTHLEPQYYQKPLKERVRTAISLLRKVGMRTPISVARAALCNGLLDPTFATAVSGSTTLLHAVARAIVEVMLIIKRENNARYSPDSKQWHRVYWESVLSDLKQLLKDLISLGADLHAISNSNQRTPLFQLLGALFEYVGHRIMRGPRYHILPQVLEVWLNTLSDAGVSLVQYGKEEKSLLRQGLVSRDIKFVKQYINLYLEDRFILRTISFAYGKTPAEWHVWVSDPFDELVGQFWDSIENPAYTMPGTWEEEEGEEEDDDVDDDSHDDDDDEYY